MEPALCSQAARQGRSDVNNALLWVSDAPVPENLAAAVLGRYALLPVATSESLVGHADAARGAIIYPVGLDVRRISFLLEELDRTSLVGMLLLPSENANLGHLAARHGQFAVGYATSTTEVLSAQILTMLQLQQSVHNLHRELAQVRTFGRDIGQAFDQIDEEMRLAARLQRDFLPKKLPFLGPLRFGALFRPATWVSGDIYDVVRLDEQHFGFYVADAVGHGLPAALLTMFIKQALPMKRIAGASYTIVPPDESVAHLNEAICAQNLTSCQFCTACYCIVNISTLELTFARGGHPQPILLRGREETTELESDGGLLGIIPGESFELGRLQMRPGDRLILHSDGVEAIFRHDGSTGRDEFIESLQPFRRLPIEDMMLELTGMIDSRQGSLHPEDDVTLVALEVLE